MMMIIWISIEIRIYFGHTDISRMFPRTRKEYRPPNLFKMSTTSFHGTLARNKTFSTWSFEFRRIVLRSPPSPPTKDENVNKNKRLISFRERTLGVEVRNCFEKRTELHPNVADTKESDRFTTFSARSVQNRTEKFNVKIQFRSSYSRLGKGMAAFAFYILNISDWPAAPSTAEYSGETVS